MRLAELKQINGGDDLLAPRLKRRKTGNAERRRQETYGGGLKRRQVSVLSSCGGRHYGDKVRIGLDAQRSGGAVLRLAELKQINGGDDLLAPRLKRRKSWKRRAAAAGDKYGGGLP